MLLSDLGSVSRKVAETSGRRDKIEHLASFLRRLEPQEIDIAVAFLSGDLRQGRIGIGPATLHAALPSSAAEAPTLTLGEVDRTFGRIIQTTGPGSTRERSRFLHELLRRATLQEQELLARLVLGELRQGALEGLMVEAIAHSAEVPAGEVRRALMLAGDLRAVAQAAFREGVSGLRRFSLQLFTPLQPMLAQPAEDVAEALDRMGRAALEYKLDGARVQIHKGGSDVRVFSRRLNDVTAAVPEIVEAVGGLSPREIVLDGEVLALRPDGSPHPFQTTMRRFGRKLEVDRMRRELPLRTFVFDCLYVDGETLIDRAGEERFTALADALPGSLLIPRTVTADPAEADGFLRKALAEGHEGIMAKSLEAPYAAGGRGRAWLKVKPAHTLDLVVLAAEWGHGRRRGWLSNLHLGARDPSSGDFVMLGKTFKGMTDEVLAWQTEALQKLETRRDRHVVHVRPELVVEVAFNDIQTSPKYPGGLALRFARVSRYRPDKRAEDADTIDAVRELYAAQTA